MSALLNEWEKNYAEKDDRRPAYMLATVHHETDRTMTPIEEYGKGKGRRYRKKIKMNGQPTAIPIISSMAGDLYN